MTEHFALLHRLVCDWGFSITSQTRFSKTNISAQGAPNWNPTKEYGHWGAPYLVKTYCLLIGWARVPLDRSNFDIQYLSPQTSKSKSKKWVNHCGASLLANTHYTVGRTRVSTDWSIFETVLSEVTLSQQRGWLRCLLFQSIFSSLFKKTVSQVGLAVSRRCQRTTEKPQYCTKDDHVESNKILSLSHRLVCKELQNSQSQISLRSNAKSSVAD